MQHNAEQERLLDLPREQGESPAAIGTWEWDRRLDRVSWSPALERLHGLAPGTFGGSFEDFLADIHPEDRARVITRIQEAFEGTVTPYRAEYRIVLPDGAIRWVEAHAELVRDEGGTVSGMRGICRDISIERARARYRDAVYAVNSALAHATDLDAGLRVLAQIVGEAFDCEYAEYRDSSPDGGTLHARATWWPAGAGEAVTLLSTDVDSRTDSGPVSRSWKSGVPVWVDDLEAEPAYARRDAALAAGLRGAFAFPVTAAGGVLGVLGGFTRRPLFDQALQGTLDAMTAEVSQFVRRLSAERELQTRELQQRTAAQLGRAALAGTPRQQLLDEAVRSIAETLDVEYTKVLQLLPSGQALRLVSGLGWQEGLVGRGTVGSGLDSQAGYTLSVDGAVIVDDLRTEQRFSGPPLLHDHGVVSGISTVIRGSDGPWGVVGAHTAQSRAFSPDDTLFLETVANILAAAIDRDERERAQRFLARASEALFGSLDYHEVLRKLAALAVSEIADWCVVHMLDEQGNRQSIEMAHRDPEKVALVQRYREVLSPPQRDTVVDRAIASGETQFARVTPDAIREAGIGEEAERLLEELELQAVIVAPLIARGEPLGAISLVSAESGYPYGPIQRDLASELARRAAIAIENARLFEQTREALRIREDFVSVASHELRSPLTSILGFSSRLGRRPKGRDAVDEEVAASVRTIRAEAERMQHTLELFLDMAGLDTGRFATEIEETDLVELLAHETEVLRQRQPDIDLEVSLPEDQVRVETDPARVQTILSNLLSNAVKYGGDPARVRVVLERRGEGATIRVRDYGAGIPPEARDRVFERFYRGVTGEGASARGLGLGLYISKQVADRLGADLAFETEEGDGTEFLLTLPPSAPDE